MLRAPFCHRGGGGGEGWERGGRGGGEGGGVVLGWRRRFAVDLGPLAVFFPSFVSSFFLFLFFFKGA